ncbi:MAG: hypothetical protein ACYC0V_01835 [Armatimonadota bacterium]
MKRRAGRKEIILPYYSSLYAPKAAAQQEVIVIALARAHRRKKLIDNGQFGTIAELA